MTNSNKNLLMALVATFGFIFMWDALVVRRYGPPTKAAVSPVASPRSSIQPAVVSPRDAKNAPAVSKSSVDLKLPDTEITMTADGAAISAWRVKEQNDWVELVYKQPAVNYLPLQTFEGYSFAVESEKPTEVVWVLTHPNGFRVRKTLKLKENGTLHHLSLSFENPTKAPVTVETNIGWGPGLNKLSIGHTEKEERATQPEMQALVYGERLKRLKPGIIFNREIDRLEAGAC
jgi:hypothetical protein